MAQSIYTENAPAAIGPYSQAVVLTPGDLLYSSGQIPLDPATGEMVAGGITEQTTQVCKNLKAVLAAAGLGFENVIKTTCFLSDMENFSAFNDIYGTYFTSKPARSCFAVKALPKGALVEVEVVAAK